MAPFWFWTSLALFGVVANSQVATYSYNGAALSVNIPASTSSGSTKTIYFQISAAKGTQWISFGQGNMMAGSNMYVVYAASSSNVTVSPRAGTGEVLPLFDPSTQISVLEGSGVNSDGSFVANVRCDNCLSWNGGTMDPKSSSAQWIWALKSGSALNSASTSETIQIHDIQGAFNLDLTKGTGGSSNNPFLTSTSSSGGASPSASSGASTPLASSNPSSGSSSSSSSSASNTSQVRNSHAIIMSLVFLVMFPTAALTLYLPYAEKVRYIHGPLQVLALLLSIIGLALGVVLGQRLQKVDAYHQIIGYLVVGALLFFQPALGILQHLHFRREGGRSPMGVVHRWLGRTMIILGIINGGLGFMQSGPVGSQNVPSYSVVAYCIVAGVMLSVYLSILLAVSFRAKHGSQPRVGEKFTPDREQGGYQMQRSAPNFSYKTQFQAPPARSKINPNNSTVTDPNAGYGYGNDRWPTYR